MKYMKLLRWHFRQHIPIREIERRTGLSRNTIRMLNRWIDGNGMSSIYPAAVRVGYDPALILGELRGMLISGRWPDTTLEWSQTLVASVRIACRPGLLRTTTVFGVIEDRPESCDEDTVGMMLSIGPVSGTDFIERGKGLGLRLGVVGADRDDVHGGRRGGRRVRVRGRGRRWQLRRQLRRRPADRDAEGAGGHGGQRHQDLRDRKSTRLNSSHRT